MAYNNHFMFSTLTPNPTPPSSALENKILASNFSSLASLRETFIATADSMFGPGYTWLIKRNPRQQYSILNTYLAGSPFPAAHYRRQPIDVATLPSSSVPNSAAAYADVIARQGRTGNFSAGAMGQHSESGNMAPGGVELDVLMCVNTWQHCWLMDWGIGGKRGYLEAWWDSIDWGVVEANAGLGDMAVRLKQNYNRN